MSNTTRSHKELDGELDAERRREFMHAILQDVRALERMIAEQRFETGVRRIGAEQEMFIIDQQWVPARGALKILELLRPDDHYTTELGMFQLEANCDPQVFTGDGLSRMQAQLDALVNRAREAARQAEMDVVLMGILPTMRKSDLALDSMVPSPRYMTLNRIITELRGRSFEFSIKGLDELIIEHDSVMLEACNSSFQVHLQVTPQEFARVYNLAQVLAGPIMAISANSPILFGRRLWAETRIALFRQAVDTRPTHHLRETEARVSFGTRWVKDSVVEIFKEDIARFRTLVSTDLDEDPMAKLDRGEAPLLKALRLHNGTIYRWNRPCYGIIDGKPHLRIENRVMPAGPSTLDEVANGAFWFALMTELAHRGDEVHRRIDFDQAGANFYTAAREGLGSSFVWLDGEDISARNLVLDKLLPIAEAGLRRAGIVDADVKRYLGVVDERVRTARTGARWQFSSWNSLRDRATPGERANALVAATIKRQQTGRPVSEWERARLDEADVTRHNYLRVEQYMTTDLFTVSADDPVEMIANLMIWERIRHVPVEDKDHNLIGLVTQRAVLRFIAAHGISHRTGVSAIMRKDVLTVSPETPTVDAIRLMRKKRIGCLPVVQDGKLVGILTEEDFLTIASKLLEERLGDGTVEAIDGPGTGRSPAPGDRSAAHRLAAAAAAVAQEKAMAAEPPGVLEVEPLAPAPAPAPAGEPAKKS